MFLSHFSTRKSKLADEILLVEVELMRPENSREEFNQYKDFTFSMIDRDLKALEKQIAETESITPDDVDKDQLKKDLEKLFEVVGELERIAGHSNM